jgi:hypothetical protein
MARIKNKRFNYTLFIESKQEDDIIKTLEGICDRLKKNCKEQNAGCDTKYPDVKYVATSKTIDFMEAKKWLQETEI